MQLSVIFICWNSLPHLRKALASMRETLNVASSSEIIIIDNGSTDGTDDFIAARYPYAIYRRLSENRGVAYARNRGIELAQGEYIWLLDDDTIANAQTLRTMLCYMHETPQCGICGCRLTDSSGNVQQSYKTYPGLGIKQRNLFHSIWQNNILHIRLFNKKTTNRPHSDIQSPSPDPYAEQVAAGKPFEPVYIIGACQLIRRTVIEQIGMLDQHIFYGPEDADFCIRAKKAGWHIAYLPQTTMIHQWQRITNRNPFSPIARRHIAALFYFYRKHRKIC